MTHQPDDVRDVLRSVWAAQGESSKDFDTDFDTDCSPTKSCKNMVGVSFDGLAEPGSDLRTAWREKLAREGKLSNSGGSIRDLILGSDESP